MDSIAKRNHNNRKGSRKGKEPKTLASKKETYSFEERVEILNALALNNYNYSKTARELGVSKGSLYRWMDDADLTKQVGNHSKESRTPKGDANPKGKPAKKAAPVEVKATEVIDEKRIQQAVDRSVEGISTYHPDFMRKLFEAKNAAVERLIQLIPNARSISDLTSVITSLTDMTGETKQPTVNNFFTQINNTLRDKGYGTKGNSDNGHQPE